MTSEEFFTTWHNLKEAGYQVKFSGVKKITCEIVQMSAGKSTVTARALDPISALQSALEVLREKEILS